MHAVGERKYADAVVGRQQQRRKTAAAAAPYRKIGKPRRDQQDMHPAQLLPAHAEQRRLGQAFPVAAQRRKPVEGVDAGVGVTGHRSCVFFYKARAQLCQTEKGYAGQQRYQQRQRCAAEAPSKGAQAVLLHRDARQKAGRQHRTEQQRLRLDGQRQTEPDGGGQVAALLQQQEAEQQRQRKGPINLLPDGGIEQQQRVERRERSQHQCHLPPHRTAPGHRIDQRRRHTVANRRHQRQQ